jgi:hypothetical protein
MLVWHIRSHIIFEPSHVCGALLPGYKACFEFVCKNVLCKISSLFFFLNYDLVLLYTEQT